MWETDYRNSKINVCSVNCQEDEVCILFQACIKKWSCISTYCPMFNEMANILSDMVYNTLLATFKPIFLGVSWENVCIRYWKKKQIKDIHMKLKPLRNTLPWRLIFKLKRSYLRISIIGCSFWVCLGLSTLSVDSASIFGSCCVSLSTHCPILDEMASKSADMLDMANISANMV